MHLFLYSLLLYYTFSFVRSHLSSSAFQQNFSIPSSLRKYIIHPRGINIQWKNSFAKGKQAHCYHGYIGHDHIVVKKLSYNPSGKRNQDMIREAEKMIQFNHPYLIPLYGLSWKVERHPKVILLLPYMNQGSLNQYSLESRRQHKKFPGVRWLREILIGVRYMHSKGYQHYDLSAKNIFIHDDHVQIGDFGQTRHIDNKSGNPMYIRGMKDMIYIANLIETAQLYYREKNMKVVKEMKQIHEWCHTEELIRNHLMYCDVNVWIKKF